MTQSHSQIKLTPKPINLDEVTSFVLGENLSICSDSSPSNRSNITSITAKDIEAQATIAKMEFEAIVFQAFEEFDLHKISIHYRLGNCSSSDIAVAFAVSSNSAATTNEACKMLSAKLNGITESWKESETTKGNSWINQN